MRKAWWEDTVVNQDKNEHPPRIYAWAWFKMPKSYNTPYRFSDMSDYVKKHKEDYVAFLEKHKLSPTYFERDILGIEEDKDALRLKEWSKNGIIKG